MSCRHLTPCTLYIHICHFRTFTNSPNSLWTLSTKFLFATEIFCASNKQVARKSVFVQPTDPIHAFHECFGHRLVKQAASVLFPASQMVQEISILVSQSHSFSFTLSPFRTLSSNISPIRKGRLYATHFRTWRPDDINMHATPSALNGHHHTTPHDTTIAPRTRDLFSRAIRVLPHGWPPAHAQRRRRHRIQELGTETRETHSPQITHIESGLEGRIYVHDGMMMMMIQQRWLWWNMFSYPIVVDPKHNVVAPRFTGRPLLIYLTHLVFNRASSFALCVEWCLGALRIGRSFYIE